MKGVDWQSFAVVTAFVVIILITLGAAAHDCNASASTPPEIKTELVRPSQATSEVRARRGSPLPRRALYRHADPPVADHELPSIDERRLIDLALYRCERSSARRLDVWLALRMLRLEQDVGLPASMRGITLAAWCGENAYGADAIGDGGLAVGALQQHPWWSRRYDFDRTDVTAATYAWLSHLVIVHRTKARPRCGKRRAWRAAELWISQGGRKSGYSCKLMSGHWSRLERWRRFSRFGRYAAVDHRSASGSGAYTGTDAERVHR